MQEEKQVTIQDVIAKRKEHNRKVDIKLIMKAYDYAKAHHGDQCRRSGEPYIIHPLNVAYILADIGLDDSTICAALLHDVVEDTDVTDIDIKNEFSEEIAEMVAGVTKLSKIQYVSVTEQQVENYRKMFLAMGKDNGGIKGRDFQLTVSFIGMINSYITCWKLKGDSLTKKTIDSMVRQFMHGIFN